MFVCVSLCVCVCVFVCLSPLLIYSRPHALPYSSRESQKSFSYFELTVVVDKLSHTEYRTGASNDTVVANIL